MNELFWKVPLGDSLGKNHHTSKNKTTVALYLDKSLVQQAKNHSLNLSAFMENALKQPLTLSLTKSSLSGKRNLRGGRRSIPAGPTTVNINIPTFNRHAIDY